MLSKQPEINYIIDQEISFCGHKSYDELPELVRDFLVAKCVFDDFYSSVPDFSEYIHDDEIAELLINYIRFSSRENATELAQCMKEKCHKYFSNQLINQYESKYENFTGREPANENF